MNGVISFLLVLICSTSVSAATKIASAQTNGGAESGALPAFAKASSGVAACHAVPAIASCEGSVRRSSEAKEDNAIAPDSSTSPVTDPRPRVISKETAACIIHGKLSENPLTLAADSPPLTPIEKQVIMAKHGFPVTAELLPSFHPFVHYTGHGYNRHWLNSPLEAFVSYNVQKEPVAVTYPGCALFGIDNVGLFSEVGNKDSGLQEDNHVYYYQTCAEPHMAFMGVFDGHSSAIGKGHHPSETAADFLHLKVRTRIASCRPTDTTDYTDTLIAGFLDFDRYYCTEHLTFAETAGTVAGTVMINSTTVFLAHIGDIRIFVKFIDGTTFVTTDHDVLNPIEMERILRAGCFITDNQGSPHNPAKPDPFPHRINGRINSARSFGDLRAKRPSRSYATLDGRDAATGCPTVTHFPRQTIAYIAILCDGILDPRYNVPGKKPDGMSNQEVFAIIDDSLSHGVEPHDIGRQLAMEAKKRGSRDNLTAMIVQLRHGSETL